VELGVEMGRMEDAKLFEQMLGLKEPWGVKNVALNMKEQRVVVDVEVKAGTVWAEAGEQLPVHGWEEREWRHLDTMQFETIIRARVPRVRRPKLDEQGEECGWTTEMVAVPWAGPRSRWTLLFEAWAVHVLQASESVKAGCGLLRLHWESAHGIMQRAVERGLARRSLEEVNLVGIDEKSFGRGHDYATVCNDLSQGRVLEVVPERTTEAARRALQCLGIEQSRKVKAACLDMSAAFEKALILELPWAMRVYDRFHISKILGEAVDKVRRSEHKELLAQGDEILKGSRYDWLYDPAALSGERLQRLEALLQADLRTGRAYGYRLNFYEFWQCAGRDEGRAFFKTWYQSAVRSRLQPIKVVARTLKNHLEGLLNYFSYRITNAMSEGLNSAIQKLKATARGFRNFANFRTRILFFLGRLSLLPQTH
jgi:transposase